MSPLTDYLLPALFVAFPHIGGLAGALMTRTQIATWYRTLIKPPWNPPNWVFGPVWTTLYTCMGFASWLVYKEVGLCSTLMYLYAAQLALNWIWSPLFFCAHRVGLSLLNVLATLGLVAACVREFHPVSPLASRLMLPYLGWICLALSLNSYIWFFNDSRTLRGDRKAEEKEK